MKKKEEDSSNDIQVDIGRIYREAREAANVSLKEAHFSTQLSVEVLEHIENNRFAEIGASVYVRGYLGIYARYLAIDGKNILSIYEAQNAATPIEIRPSLAQSQSFGSRKLRSKRHSKTLSTLVVAVLLVGLGYGYFLLSPLLFPDVGTSTPTTTVEMPADDSAAGVASNNLDNLLNEADATLNSANEAISTSSNQVNSDADGLTQEVEIDINSFLAEGARVNGDSAENSAAGGVDTTTEMPQITVTDVELASTTEQSADSTTTTDAGDSATPANGEDSVTATATAKTLEINFTQECWVKITDSENKTLTSRLYRQGSSLTVTGMPPFAIVIGNQDGLGATTYDGKPISLLDFKTGNISYTLN